VFCCGSGSCVVSDPATGRVFFNVLFCTVLRHEPGSGTGTVPGPVCKFFNVLVCTDALAGGGGGGTGDGRLRASATTFLGPGTCLKSVVNSEMYASWRTCLADQGAETRLMAKVSGKWSVRRRKLRPSKTYRKCRMAAKAAQSSRANVEYFDSGEDNFLLKKARGNHKPLVSCCNTPPTWVSEASTAREMVAPGVGCTSLVQDANAALPAMKAALADSDQTNVLGFPRIKYVKGYKVTEIPAEIFGKNLSCQGTVGAVLCP